MALSRKDCRVSRGSSCERAASHWTGSSTPSACRAATGCCRPARSCECKTNIVETLGLYSQKGPEFRRIRKICTFEILQLAQEENARMYRHLFQQGALFQRLQPCTASFATPPLNSPLLSHFIGEFGSWNEGLRVGIPLNLTFTLEREATQSSTRCNEGSQGGRMVASDHHYSDPIQCQRVEGQRANSILEQIHNSKV